MPDSLQARNDWIYAFLGYRIRSTSDLPETTAFGQQHEALRHRVMAAMGADPAQRSALTAAWAALEQFTTSGQSDRAQAVATRLHQSIDRILASAPGTDTERFGISPGLVAQRRSELEALLRQQIDTASTLVTDGIGGLEPELAQVIEEPRKLVAAVEQYVDSLFARIDVDLNDAAQQGDVPAVRQRITAWRSEIAADDGFTAIRDAASVFGLEDPGEVIEAMLNELLVELESQPA